MAMNIYQHGLQDLKQLGNPHLRKFGKVPELVSLCLRELYKISPYLDGKTMQNRADL